MKRLVRSRENRMLAGVCGGLGRYLEVDPTAIRLLAAFLVLITGCFPGILWYIVAWAIIPEAPAAGEI
ncbi:MAG: PspC domain-containing protein [Bacteroidota bacterium]